MGMVKYTEGSEHTMITGELMPQYFDSLFSHTCHAVHDFSVSN